jgi:hypothetical protein
MVLQPLIIGMYGFTRFLNCFFEIIPLFAAEDEVAPVYFLLCFLIEKVLRDCINIFVFHITDKYWKNPLAVLCRMCNLLIAHLRYNRILADQE